MDFDNLIILDLSRLGSIVARVLQFLKIGIVNVSCYILTIEARRVEGVDIPGTATAGINEVVQLLINQPQHLRGWSTGGAALAKKTLLAPASLAI